MLELATWNINSVRLREELVARFLKTHAPDILCLQETKCPVEKFPRERFAELGWPHLIVRGQKGYNGVAILSRMPLEDPGSDGDAVLCRNGQPRHVSARLPDGTALHNLYVPAGGDEPDPAVNEKFAHKLDFVDRITRWGAHLDGRAILVGDLNIAPLAEDVWSHRQLLRVVSHTPVETEGLTGALEAGGWTDVVRRDIPPPEKLYTWWSYRAKDWTASDRGRRLDHIWTRGGVRTVPGSARVLKDWRGATQPSDHVPVMVTLA